MTTPHRTALLALALAPLLGCAGAKATPTQECQLEILRKAPERPYEVVGELLEHVMSVPPGGPIDAVRPKACALGADALIVEREQVLNYFGHVLVEAKAIKWVVAPPPAATPAATPAPTPPAEPAPAAPEAPPTPKPGG